jgi:hypothetical protein
MSNYTWLRPEIEAEIKFAEWTAAASSATPNSSSCARPEHLSRASENHPQLKIKNSLASLPN